MLLREALIAQAPSLTLQRAAADEISALDAILIKQAGEIAQLTADYAALLAAWPDDKESSNETN